MGDATLSKIEERITLKNSNDESSVTKSQAVESVDNCGLIPTAIVKPKYQKLSFDERQLPIRGSTDAELWDHSSNQSATITSTPRKIQKHLPKNQKSFTRQTRKIVNKMNSSESCSDYDVTDKEAINSNHRVNEKDIDCSVMQIQQNSVAVVQPIKKVIDATIDTAKCESSKNKAVDFKNHRTTSSKLNEIVPKCSISECGINDNNNLNVGNRKCIEREKNFVKDGNDDKKVPIKNRKDNSGKIIVITYFIFQRQIYVGMSILLPLGVDYGVF